MKLTRKDDWDNYFFKVSLPLSKGDNRIRLKGKEMELLLVCVKNGKPKQVSFAKSHAKKKVVAAKRSAHAPNPYGRIFTIKTPGKAKVVKINTYKEPDMRWSIEHPYQGGLCSSR